jgi:hypothetical protein
MVSESTTRPEPIGSSKDYYAKFFFPLDPEEYVKLTIGSSARTPDRVRPMVGLFFFSKMSSLLFAQ